jgi:hypothetical protein
MSTTPRPDDAVLACIASGANIDYLIARWPMGEVTEVLRRNHLVVDAAGRVCPASGQASVVLSVLCHHPDVKVRNRAQQAVALSNQLAAFWRNLQDHHAQGVQVASARDGMNALIDELGVLQSSAIAVARTLKTPAVPGEAA